MAIDSSKFRSNSLAGAVRVSGGYANISLPTSYYALEGNVSFNILVRTGSVDGPVVYTSPAVTLKDNSSIVSLTANTATVNEGDLVAFTLVTANALGNATLYYSVFPVTANVTASDFVANSGSFSLTNNAGTFTLKANADLSLIDETGENFKVQLRTGAALTGNIVYTTSNIAIRDTSNAYNVISFAPSTSSSLENSNITFTFTATNVPFGTVFYYETTGNATVSANTGSFVLNSVSNTITISAGDIPSNTIRAFTVNLRTGSAAGPIVATSSTAYVIDSALAYMSATGGNEVYTINGYRVHKFLSSNTFTITRAGGSPTLSSIDYLIVAGGGTGLDHSGAGGGGVVYSANSLLVTAGTPYTIIVGGVGGDSSAFTANAFAGGPSSPSTGRPGGSGAGGGRDGGAGGINPAGGTTQISYPAVNGIGLGSPGGYGYVAPPTPSAAGGGGGAGQNGGNYQPGGQGGAGGNGYNSSISGTPVYYAGGGGGGGQSVGAGGLGTGPGSYGGGSNGGGQQNGTQGIVIIRYPFVESPTYGSLTSNVTNGLYIGENEYIYFTLNTLNLANNTLMYYTTIGNVISSNFISGNTGSFRSTANATTITLRSNTNIPTNEERYFQLQVRAGSLTDTVVATSNVYTIKDDALLPMANGQAEYTVAGTYSWIAPLRVSNVSVVAIGGGGSGYSQGPGPSTMGGGGGGLGWKNNIPVISGNPYTVVVGDGGRQGDYVPGTASRVGGNGNASYFIDITTVAGYGGYGGGAGISPFVSGGYGGGYVGDGGGNGGSGAQDSYASGGGAGAGGYSGDGGYGGGSRIYSGRNGGVGNGGGGAGGNGANPGYNGGGGGGVHLYGQGDSGVKLETITVPPPAPSWPNDYGVGGGGGSGGNNGANTYPGSPQIGNGGLFGGGGGGTWFNPGGAGARGAVRIIWGGGRYFPNVMTGNVF